MKNKKDLNYYMGLNWSFLVEQDQHEGKKLYVIRVAEYPTICTDGYSMNEAMDNIKEAMKGIFAASLEDGIEILEPINKDAYKGQISYRTTSERHYALVKAAKLWHKSLSRTIDEIVDSGLKHV